MKKYKTIIVFLLGVIVGGIIHNNQKYFYNSYNLIYDNIYLLNKYIFGPKLAWTMVNVNNSDAQGDAHVIQIKGGKTVLIDAGANVKDKLIPFLNDNRIKYLDYAFISHAHKDHYGGIPILIRNNISINEIYFNLPNKSVCDRELPWGCNYFDVKSHFNFYEKNSIIRKEVNGGEIFDLGNDVILKILYAFDGYNTPFGQTDINDTSLIMSLESGDYKFLFTGDLNAKLSQYIVETSKDIKADVLKVPHHGTDGLARN